MQSTWRNIPFAQVKFDLQNMFLKKEGFQHKLNLITSTKS